MSTDSSSYPPRFPVECAAAIEAHWPAWLRVSADIRAEIAAYAPSSLRWLLSPTGVSPTASDIWALRGLLVGSLPADLCRRLTEAEPATTMLLRAVPILSEAKDDPGSKGVPLDWTFWQLLLAMGRSPDIISTCFGLRFLRQLPAHVQAVRDNASVLMNHILDCQDPESGGFWVRRPSPEAPMPATVTASHFAVSTLRTLRIVAPELFSRDQRVAERLERALAQLDGFLARCIHNEESGGFSDTPNKELGPFVNPTTAALKLLSDLDDLRGRARRRSGSRLAKLVRPHLRFLRTALSPDGAGWRISPDSGYPVCLCATFFALSTLRSFARRLGGDVRREFTGLLRRYGRASGPMHQFVLDCQLDDEGGFVAVPKPGHRAGVPFAVFGLGILDILREASRQPLDDFFEKDRKRRLIRHLRDCRVGLGLYCLGHQADWHHALVYPSALVAANRGLLRRAGVLSFFDDDQLAASLRSSLGAGKGLPGTLEATPVQAAEEVAGDSVRSRLRDVLSVLRHAEKVGGAGGALPQDVLEALQRIRARRASQPEQ